jgi:hypothetical protein
MLVETYKTTNYVISMGVAIYLCVKIKEKISWVASTMRKMQMKNSQNLEEIMEEIRLE